MLDEKTIEIIKSTVPVLEEHGEEITGRFYDLLFQHHPESLNIFNQTNQRKNTAYGLVECCDCDRDQY